MKQLTDRELETIWAHYATMAPAGARRVACMRAAIAADREINGITGEAQPAEQANGLEAVLTKSQQRMLHDFPHLQQFHTKHALGPMLAPSCLCCGQQTHPITRPVSVKHLELPGIVICKVCKDATTPPAQPAKAEQPAEQRGPK